MQIVIGFGRKHKRRRVTAFPARNSQFSLLITDFQNDSSVAYLQFTAGSCDTTPMLARTLVSRL